MMNLDVLKSRVECLLDKLRCSKCLQAMETVYRSNTGMFICEPCAQQPDSESHDVVDKLWTDISAMFRELNLCLSNGESIGNDKRGRQLKENTPIIKRRKVSNRKNMHICNSNDKDEFVKFFISGDGANFFKNRIESCLSFATENITQDPEPERVKAESSFQEQNDTPIQTNTHSEKMTEDVNNAEKMGTVNGSNIDSDLQNIKQLENTESPEEPSEYESDLDLFVPPTPQASDIKSCFMGTSLSFKSKTTLARFAQYFNSTVIDNLSHDPDVHCLLVENENITLKYLYARCKKIPIVRFDWAVDSLDEGRFMPLGPYKVKQKDLKIPSFFLNLSLILCPPFSNYSNNDVKAVLQATGAKVCNFEEWQPGLNELQMLRLFVAASDTNPYNDFILPRMIAKYRAPIVDVSYFVAVLTSGKLKNIEKHLLVDVSKDDLLYLGFPERLTIRTESDIDSDSEEN